MDAIAYAHADKQQQRIKKVIAEPDSTSGLVTMPSTIAVGETVTIPAGRVVVHPNLQVDGTLDIQGDLFIPSGGTSDQLVSKSGDTMTGNLNFSGTGLRITGDFSNATHTNRTMFNSGIPSTSTIVGIAPTGSGNAGQLNCYALSDVDNSPALSMIAQSTILGVHALAVGTGSFLPMAFSTGGIERLRIDTSGNVLVTGSGGLGYGTGSGGTVTQLTSKGTEVTLNKPCGQITMNNASLAAGAIAQFVVVNNLCSLGDTVLVNQNTVTPNTQVYQYRCTCVAHGLFGIEIKNTAGGALADAITLNFVVIKGSTN